MLIGCGISGAKDLQGKHSGLAVKQMGRHNSRNSIDIARIESSFNLAES
jgi:hypothetical protein